MIKLGLKSSVIPPRMCVLISDLFRKNDQYLFKARNNNLISCGQLENSKWILCCRKTSVKCGYEIFFSIFFLVFVLIDAIKHKVEMKLVFFLRDCLGEVSRKLQNKISFVSFRVIFSGGNKNFIQNKRESLFTYRNF